MQRSNFAILLYGNVAAIVAVAGIYGTAAFNQSVDEGQLDESVVLQKYRHHLSRK